MKEQTKSLLRILCNVIFVLLIIATGALILLKVDLLKTINLDGLTNDYCQTQKNLSSINKLICDNKYKKEKVIIMFVDSLAFDQLLDLHKLEKYNLTNFYKNEAEGHKQSGALFESIFTGKFSRNYLSAKITIDNLAQQFKNANMKTYYRIKQFPIGGLLDKKKLDEIEILKKSERIPLTYFCEEAYDNYSKNYLENELKEEFIDDLTKSFKNNLTVEDLYKRSDELFKSHYDNLSDKLTTCFTKLNFHSFVYFTKEIDNINHSYDKYYPTARYATYHIEKYFESLIKWINEKHNEYALVLISDHGGQFYYGEDTVCIHGCNRPGNEGIFILYTKELGANFEKLKIKEKFSKMSILDISCTLLQMLKNVNLPLESTCHPRILGNDNLLRFVSVKSKEIQLKKYLEKLGEKYPNLNEKYHNKYYNKLNNNKYSAKITNENEIYEIDEKFYEDYMDYLLKIQNEIFGDVIDSGKSLSFTIIFYLIFICLLVALYYNVKKIIMLTKKKLDKYQPLNYNNININKCIFILVGILLIDVIMCVIFNKSSNISSILDVGIFLKYVALLIFMITVYFFEKNIKNYKDYRKVIFIISVIIIVHFFMYKIEFLVLFDSKINTQSKSDFIKIFICYPLLLFYACLELLNNRNYYIFPKYKIKYIYLLIPYLIYLSYNFLIFDAQDKQHFHHHEPDMITLTRKIYIMLFILLFFLKPFILKIKNNLITFHFSKNIFNIKLFILILVIFICTEIERVSIISLYCFSLFYICNSYAKEKDILLKIVYVIILLNFPLLHFIANQGTYGIDTSIKVTSKTPSKFADDVPFTMGAIFVLHKFRFFFVFVAYFFNTVKMTKNKLIDYYSSVARLFNNIYFFSIIICYLFYLNYQRENSYVQILFIIATKGFIIVLLDFSIFINYLLYNLIVWTYKKLHDIEDINYTMIKFMENEKTKNI